MRNRLLILSCGVLSLALGCSSPRTAGTPGSPYESYGAGNVTVIGGADSAGGSTTTGGTTADTSTARTTVSTPVGSGECVSVSDSLCVPVNATGEWCERSGGPVDVVMVGGEVVKTICYPPPDNNGGAVLTITADATAALNVLKTANRTAVTFDPATDGRPISGDIELSGNNVSFYGNGPDKTIIDGNVAVGGNNVRLRGLTIKGDLHINLNRASVVLCRILGNVEITSSNANGSIFVETDVFGNFKSESNNNTLTGNDVSGNWQVSGHNDVCDKNSKFADANNNQLVEASERGDALACP